MSDEWIRASEIANYVYCQRAWWLQRVTGHLSQNVHEIEYGQAHHEEHGRVVQQSNRAWQLVYIFLFVGGILLAIWLWQGG